MNQKTLYLECASGISGDMTLGALLDLGADREGLMRLIQSLPIKGYQVRQGETEKQGIRAAYFHVYLSEPKTHNHHEHRTMKEIAPILAQMDAPEEVKQMALGIFQILARAEAKAHGIEVEKVHFHEVGAVDSLIDIVGASYCCWSLGITEAYVSPLSEGCGHVHCAHGLLPVPVPAVQNILIESGLPMHRITVEGEMVTPTGAAIASWLWNHKPLPESYRLLAAGYGAGEKDFPQANILRAYLIEEEKAVTDGGQKEEREVSSYQKKPAKAFTDQSDNEDTLWVLETNMDDVTGEALGYVMEKLMDAGARDVYYVPVYMKKNRPGYLLHVLCTEEKRERMEELIFLHTTTIGIRRYPVLRTCMNRTITEKKTPWGNVRMKQCHWGEIHREYPEYEDIRRICEETPSGFTEVYRKTTG